MRDWWYNDDRTGYHGEVYDDKEEVFRNGQPILIKSQSVKEVREHFDYNILETVSGDLYVLWHDKQFIKEG